MTSGKWWSVSEAAKILDVSTSTIYRWARAGALRSKPGRLGSRDIILVFVSREDLPLKRPQGAEPPNLREPEKAPVPSKRPSGTGITFGDIGKVEGDISWGENIHKGDMVLGSKHGVPGTPGGEPVRLGAAAPATARPDDEFTAHFVAYAEALESQVRETLHKLDPRSDLHAGLHSCRWERSTPVTVVLRGRGLEIEEPEKTFEWSGSYDLVSFDVYVPPGTAPRTTVLKFDVYVDEFRLARLRVDLEVADRPARGASTAEVTPASSAFASYASEDRERVLDRVASVRTSAGLDVFLDCLSLSPGEIWKPRLRQEILERDVFLLFWSSRARDSPWVEWEWTTALDEKGEADLQVHPLETPEHAPPPERLRHLHFNDPLMLVRGGYAERPSDP